MAAGLLAGFGTALYITLYDYVGYADVALLGDEVIRPRRTIPLSILLSVLVVAMLYVLLQIGVLGAVPWQSLLDSHGQPTAQAQYVGAFVVEHTWGRVAARCGHAARFGNRVCLAVRQSTRLLAHLVCRGARRRVLAGFCEASPAKGDSSRCAFCRRHTIADRQRVHARSSDRVLDCRHRADSGRRTGLCALRSCDGARSERHFECRSTRSPRFVALAGWSLAFASSGTAAIALGLGWLAVGAVVFLIAARKERWWPFLALLLLSLVLPPAGSRRDFRAELVDLEHLACVRGTRLSGL